MQPSCSGGWAGLLEWARAGEKALEAGKVVFARDCFEKAGLPERVNEARQRFLAMFPKQA